jgi:Fic family protein
MRYIHELSTWPHFNWDQEKLAILLAGVRYQQGRLMGYMQTLGFSYRAEATLEAITTDVVKSSDIEGEFLDVSQVRSSVARRLGINSAEQVYVAKNVEGVVEMMLDATQDFAAALTKERLFNWHAALFPSGRSGMTPILVGNWRDGPMQVVSGPYGHERVHFEAPPASQIESEMQKFMQWFNHDMSLDPVIKAAIAHLWFVTIHPFEDGNGRIARAIGDMQLARSDHSMERFYSMSAQIRRERASYYSNLEHTQKSGSLDITLWIEWFLVCLERALLDAHNLLGDVLKRAKFWDFYAHQSFNNRQRLVLNKLLDKFEGKLTSSKWAKLSKSSQDTALRDINDLVERQILTKDTAKGRSTSYLLVFNM